MDIRGLDHRSSGLRGQLADAGEPLPWTKVTLGPAQGFGDGPGEEDAERSVGGRPVVEHGAVHDSMGEVGLQARQDRFEQWPRAHISMQARLQKLKARSSPRRVRS